MTQDMQIATEILRQLGGAQFCLMTGACNQVAVKSGLQFNIGEGAKDGINKVLIELKSDDTYTVSFWLVTRNAALRIEEIPGVYNDMLQDIFESRTGFYTTLRARR